MYIHWHTKNNKIKYEPFPHLQQYTYIGRERYREKQGQVRSIVRRKGVLLVHNIHKKELQHR